MGLLDEFRAYVNANTPRNTRPAVSPVTVIDQGLLGNRIAQMPQRANEIAQGIQRIPADLKALGGPELNKRVHDAYNKKTPANLDKNALTSMAMDVLQTTVPAGGLLAHTVYHGSPHKFDKFDISKIGTGEGGQAYGHGLYFSESHGVAKGYAKERPGKFWIRSQGRDIGTNDADFNAADIAHIIQEYGPVEKDWLERELGARGLPAETAKKVNELLKNPLEKIRGGSLYKVDIPDEAIARMLDGDKQLIDQSVEIQQAMRKAGYTDDSFGMTGNELYSDTAWDLGGTAGGVQASEMFRNAGIPGIRYSGEGANNYVLFDDALARILEVNGQPTGLLPWAEEAAKKKK